jgi:uncharacterized protein with von Willebrand factor type A (vWA) domain
MSFISQEDFIRMGLAKSAFKNTVYLPLALDFFMPHIDNLFRMFKSLQKRLSPKLYQLHDAFLMFYQPYNIVYSSLKKSNKASPAWHKIIQYAVSSSEFYDLNKLTASSADLSLAAAYQFLSRILKKISLPDLEKLLQQQQSQAQQSPAAAGAVGGADLPSDVAEAIKSAIQETLDEARKAAEEYRELKTDAEGAADLIAGSGGSGYTKEALSVLRFFENPDEFRRRVNILRYAKIFVNRFLEIMPSSLSHQQQVSIFGGVAGAGRMFSESQIPDLLPSELALSTLGDVGWALLALKIIQRQAMVYQRAAALKPIIFIDKSGSMAEPIEYYKNIPKISIAAGLAIALHRKFNADIYLFDTEVEKVSPAKVIDILLRIEADGGTNIDPVIEEIAKSYKPTHLYLVISDGITEASDENLRVLQSIAKNIKLILINTRAGYSWVEVLRKFNNVYDVRDVASFERAVVSSLRG